MVPIDNTKFDNTLMSETAGYCLATVTGCKCDGQIKIPIVVFGRKLGCDPEELRAARSEEMLRSMASTRVAFNGLALTSAIVCLSCSDGGLAIGHVPDIDGQWTFSEVVSTDSQGSVCAKTGVINVVQELETFTGSFNRTSNCSAPSLAQPAISSESGPIVDGRAVETSIRFRLLDCRYSGTVTDDATEGFSGTALCGASAFTGTWQATRRMEPDST